MSIRKKMRKRHGVYFMLGLLLVSCMLVNSFCANQNAFALYLYQTVIFALLSVNIFFMVFLKDGTFHMGKNNSEEKSLRLFERKNYVLIFCIIFGVALILALYFLHDLIFCENITYQFAIKLHAYLLLATTVALSFSTFIMLLIFTQIVRDISKQDFKEYPIQYPIALPFFRLTRNVLSRGVVTYWTNIALYFCIIVIHTHMFNQFPEISQYKEALFGNPFHENSIEYLLALFALIIVIGYISLIYSPNKTLQDKIIELKMKAISNCCGDIVLKAEERKTVIDTIEKSPSKFENQWVIQTFSLLSTIASLALIFLQIINTSRS